MVNLLSPFSSENDIQRIASVKPFQLLHSFEQRFRWQKLSHFIAYFTVVVSSMHPSAFWTLFSGCDINDRDESSWIPCYDS